MDLVVFIYLLLIRIAYYNHIMTNELTETIISIKGRVPSLKNAKRLIRVKGRLIPIPSKAWVKFEDEMLENISAKDVPITPPYKITYKVYMKGKGNQDLDNIIAGVNDLLMKLNYLVDDRHIHEILASKYIDASDYSTDVYISSLEN